MGQIDNGEPLDDGDLNRRNISAHKKGYQSANENCVSGRGKSRRNSFCNQFCIMILLSARVAAILSLVFVTIWFQFELDANLQFGIF